MDVSKPQQSFPEVVKPREMTLSRRLGRAPGLLEHGIVWWGHTFYRLYGLCGPSTSLPMGLICICLGIFIQSFIEYLSHAYFFHGPLWYMHRGHHTKPGDKDRLLVPLAYSLPAMVVAYAVFGIFFREALREGVAAGASFWYIMFEYIHFASHHPKQLKWIQYFPGFKDLQAAHKLHHFEDADGQYKYYGFTTFFWDRVFGTM